MYMFGVAKALQEFELEKNAQLLGCSAGALAAAGLALHRDFDIIRDYVLANVIPKARSWPSGFFHGRDFLLDTLKAEGKLHEYEKLNDSQQLTVVYTSLSALKSRRVTQFDSEEHLADSLMASCCATPIAGLPFKLNGEWVMDGGIFDFQPIHGTKTVTISPFYCTSADIKPSLYVPMWWAVVPPGVRDVEWLFDLGYEDGLRWIVKNGFTGGRRNVEIPNKSTKYVGGWNTTVGRVLGYRSFESRVLDALFIGLFVCLWRPMAFMCLYLELYLQAFVSGGMAMIFGAAAKLNVIMVVVAVAFATLSLQHTMLFLLGLLVAGLFLRGLVLLVGGLQQAAAVASEDWQRCRSYMRSITSLSLFLHCMVGPSVEIKRHDFLLEHSLVYRIAMYFM
ncbi:putative patatin-like phospholipase [Phytophthora cinnamomi]|uniref:putative patatin-like phospholipase n=1 Tax=Phytophthora cinnamomi TaxID=4785 RepID=UPI003559E5FA|nr:putative patatin-like phospholipase [Phytophthora cinnamomi]